MDIQNITRLANTLGEVEQTNMPEGTKKVITSIILAAVGYWYGPKVYDMFKQMIGNLKEIDYSQIRAHQGLIIVSLAIASLFPLSTIAFHYYTKNLREKQQNS